MTPDTMMGSSTTKD